jgi:hypothetical protein
VLIVQYRIMFSRRSRDRRAEVLELSDHQSTQIRHRGMVWCSVSNAGCQYTYQ